MNTLKIYEEVGLKFIDGMFDVAAKYGREPEQDFPLVLLSLLDSLMYGVQVANEMEDDINDSL